MVHNLWTFRTIYSYFHRVFCPGNDEFKKGVTFKGREVNYEHFLITIKLEFQKAISDRA